MRILGVDPGTRIAGYGCLEVRGGGTGPAGGPRAASVDSLPMAHRVGNLVQGVGGNSVVVVGAGALRLGSSSDPIEHRLSRLALAIRGLLQEYRPTGVALEDAYFGKSVQSALRVGEARGVILAEAAAAGLPIRQFPPARVKRVVTGSGSAGKAQVRDMVQKSLGLSGPPETLDVTDALAVGLCCIEEARNIHLGSG